jgi:hypothetical protein
MVDTVFVDVHKTRSGDAGGISADSEEYGKQKEGYRRYCEKAGGPVMDMPAYKNRVCDRSDRVMERRKGKGISVIEGGRPPFPARPSEFTIRPRCVKARKSTGLDTLAGESYSSGYASREWCGMV